jgi:hypothetical protein
MKFIETKIPNSFREWVAMKLVRLAQWIYPTSEAVMAFYAQMMHDEMIYGKHITRIDPSEMVIDSCISYLGHERGIRDKDICINCLQKI